MKDVCQTHVHATQTLLLFPLFSGPKETPTLDCFGKERREGGRGGEGGKEGGREGGRERQGSEARDEGETGRDGE